MDSIVHAALEEICSQGANGLLLHDLWPKLHSPLSSNGLDAGSEVKTAIWNNLLNTPGLQFESPGVSYDSENPRIQSFEGAAELNLKIVAAEHLRNSFVGMYDIKASDAGISQIQRRVLERLAISRTTGVAQNELAKEFGIKGNNIFYVLRKLECRGLIVRQSTVIRKKEASNNSSVVTTNMLHLHRYAKHLSCQQRLEITKEGKTSVDNENAEVGAETGDDVSEECLKEDVQVKDYLPALRAICEKLEKADGKVLVVSDIKRDLGYRGTHGHRAWRNICHKLKDIHVVEEFFGKVNQKVIDMQGEKIPELIVEVLEAFGHAVKVNAYASVHVVDPLYRSKYFLMPMADLHKDIEPDLCKGMSSEEPLRLQPENNEDNSTSLHKDISMNAEEMHRVTILNHPEEIAQSLSGVHSINGMESNKEATVVSPTND